MNPQQIAMVLETIAFALESLDWRIQALEKIEDLSHNDLKDQVASINEVAKALKTS